MPRSNPEADFLALQTSLRNLRALLTSFQTALQIPTPPPPQIPHPPNPLALLSDASKLLKAQTTKLALLLLHQPFSPKEVTFILNTLSKSICPALMSGLEFCPPQQYTKTLHEHIKTALGILWQETGALLACVPEDEGSAKEEGERGKVVRGCTGMLWEQCDTVTDVGEKGLVWYIDRKVGSYAELVDDAIGELDGWDPDEDEDDSEEGSSGEENEREVVKTPTTSDEEQLETRMEGLRVSPQTTRKARVLKHLRLLKLLYPALRKRRVATFPVLRKSTAECDMPSTDQVVKLDKLVNFTRHCSERIDELAGALYSDDEHEVETALSDLHDSAVQCIEMVKSDWGGQKDEFSAWTDKWIQRLDDLRG